jgi:tRNA pseudouridine55 synthase
MDGILLVDKPAGVTSADIVRIAKRRFNVKVGHLGTLDPFATGVLPLCLGEGTKIAQFLNVADKAYVGLIRLGAETDTADCTGRVVRQAPVPAVTRAQLDDLARQLTGPQMQTPPMYSAVKQGGVPLYKLARAGREVSRAARPIVITRLTLRLAAPHTIEFEVHCSKGTYVRVLAQDIGARLGTAAHLAALRRTEFGPFRVANALTIEELKGGSIRGIIGLRDALADMREIPIDVATVARVHAGQQAALRDLPTTAHEAAKLIGPTGELVAVVCPAAQRGWRFERVFGVTRANRQAAKDAKRSRTKEEEPSTTN